MARHDTKILGGRLRILHDQLSRAYAQGDANAMRAALHDLADLAKMHDAKTSEFSSCPAMASEPDASSVDMEFSSDATRSAMLSLRAAADSLVANYHHSLQTFQRFRKAVSVLQQATCFSETPDILEQLRELFDLKAFTLALGEEAYGSVASPHCPVLPEATLQSVTKQLQQRHSEHKAQYIGSVEKCVHIAPAIAELTAHAPEGSCFVALLTPAGTTAPPGLAILLDSRPDRYSPSQATDFLEHFINVMGQTVLEMLDRELLTRSHAVDDLTGAHTRAHLMRHGARLVRQAETHGEPLTALFLDMDRFKPINDTYGHDAGDAVLRAVGRLMQSLSRQHDLVARLGGDEFVALLPHTTLQGAESLRLRLQDELAALTLADVADVADETPLAASIGVALRAPGQDLGALLNAADKAMYAEKHAQPGRKATPPEQDKSDDYV